LPSAQEFGVKLDLGPEGAAACLDRAGITFMFAPRFHPAMKTVVPVRKALSIRTAFNVLGPMLNPAGAKYGLVGVWNTDLARLMAESLKVCASSLFRSQRSPNCREWHGLRCIA
jgi:anthranilate phosphoribosyltransferase